MNLNSQSILKYIVFVTIFFSINGCSKNNDKKNLLNLLKFDHIEKGMIFKLGHSSKNINFVFIGERLSEKGKGFLYHLQNINKKRAIEISLADQREREFDIATTGRKVSEALIRIAAEVLVFRFNPNDFKSLNGDYTELMNHLIEELSKFSKRTKTVIVIESYFCADEKINDELQSIVKKHPNLKYFDTQLEKSSDIKKCELSDQDSKKHAENWSNYLTKILPNIKPRQDRRNQWRNNDKNRP